VSVHVRLPRLEGPFQRDAVDTDMIERAAGRAADGAVDNADAVGPSLTPRARLALVDRHAVVIRMHDAAGIVSVSLPVAAVVPKSVLINFLGFRRREPLGQRCRGREMYRAELRMVRARLMGSV